MVGEFFCFFLYWGHRKYFYDNFKKDLEDAIERGRDINPNIYMYAIPAALDYTASVMNFFALNMLPLSIY